MNITLEQLIQRLERIAKRNKDEFSYSIEINPTIIPLLMAVVILLTRLLLMRGRILRRVARNLDISV